MVNIDIGEFNSDKGEWISYLKYKWDGKSPVPQIGDTVNTNPVGSCNYERAKRRIFYYDHETGELNLIEIDMKD